MWAHAIALAVVLVLAMPFVGTHSMFSADEGVAIAQAHLLADGNGWTTTHPFPAADPTGDAFPLELVQRRGDQYAPFVKHPLYAVLLAGADKVAGRNAMILLSVAGTWVTAVLGALLALRIDERRGIGVVTLWLLGIFSPLLFGGYVLIAHTLGAACVAVAALSLVRVIDNRGSRILHAAIIAAAIAVAVLLRTEAQLLGIGLAIGLVAVARRRRDWSLAVFALVPLIAVGITRVFEGRWAISIMGGATTDTTPVGTASRGGVLDRLQAFVITWLLPSYRADAAALLTLLATILIVVAGVIIVREPDDRRGPLVFLGAAIAVGAFRAALGADPVPGLLVAMPLLVLVVVVAPWRTWGRDERIMALVTSSAAFALLVLATQYSTGGSGEWGGRYFAIGLPLIMPVVAIGMAWLLERVDATDRRTVGALFALALVPLAVLALRTVRNYHENGDRLVAGITAVAAHTPPGDGGLPVVISTNGAPARFAVDELANGRWLTLDIDDVGPYSDRLQKLGVDSFTFVTKNRDELDRVPGYRPAVVTEPVGGWHVVTMQRG